MTTTSHSITLNIPYDLPPAAWTALLKVYEAMPGWTNSTRDGCPFWSPDGPNGGEIIVSAEPSGLLLEANVLDTTWNRWLAEFMQQTTAALGFPVLDAEA